MKNKLFLLAVMVLSGGLFIGCATNSNMASNARELEDLAFLGTSLHLRDNPDDRPKFVDARAQLATLLADTNATGTDLIGIIQGLPLKGDAVLYRAGALLLLGRLGLDSPDIPIDAAGFQTLLRGADRGVERGLAAVVSEQKVRVKTRARGLNSPIPAK